MTAPTHSPATDANTLRRAVGRIPTCVSIVTGHGKTGPVGLTVGSLSSVSLDPPLMNFFAQQTSRSFDVLRTLDTVAVNVLHEAQTPECLAFASPTGTRFGTGEWALDHPGAPVLLGAAVSMICAVESVYPAGDHLGMMLRVRELSARDDRPMIYYRGLISRLHPQCGRQARTNRFDWWTH